MAEQPSPRDPEVDVERAQKLVFVRTIRTLWAIAFGVVLLGSFSAAWMLPAGFPTSHVKLWANQVAPWLAVLIGCAGLAAALLSKPRALVAAGNAAAVGAAGIAVGFAASHPGATAGWLALASMPALPVLFLSWRSWRIRSRPGLVEMVAPLPIAALAAWLPFACVAPPPSTHPLAQTLDTPPHEGVERRHDPHPTVRVACGDLVVSIEPLLTFESRSPDGGWTVFAPRDRQFRPLRYRTDSRITSDGGIALFDDDGESMLEWQLDPDGCGVTIEARSLLRGVVFSHLNSYARLLVTGLKEPKIRYGGMPDPIDVLPADYPSGRPSRFAYRGADGLLRVVQARDAEKGPFLELASSRMDADDELGFTLQDGPEERVQVTFEDFAAQASVELSPSAGWGVPQNAVQFVAGDDPGGAVDISLTLAGTGIGRGFDAVGHAPGVYRNRMRVRVLKLRH